MDVNIGGGMQEDGKFIAPEDGTYSFTFSAVTRDTNPHQHTIVRVLDQNGNIHNSIFDSAGLYNNINSSWMMKLAKGQVIHLNVSFGKLTAGSDRPVIFTGNLLMLDE